MLKTHPLYSQKGKLNTQAKTTLDCRVAIFKIYHSWETRPVSPSECICCKKHSAFADLYLNFRYSEQGIFSPRLHHQSGQIHREAATRGSGPPGNITLQKWRLAQQRPSSGFPAAWPAQACPRTVSKATLGLLAPLAPI